VSSIKKGRSRDDFERVLTGHTSSLTLICIIPLFMYSSNGSSVGISRIIELVPAIDGHSPPLTQQLNLRVLTFKRKDNTSVYMSDLVLSGISDNGP